MKSVLAVGRDYYTCRHDGLEGSSSTSRAAALTSLMISAWQNVSQVARVL